MRPTKAVAFVLIAAFWVTMNYLLWRSEFKVDDSLGAPFPADRVWEKMLTAPDDSTLDVMYEGRKIGYARWRPNVGEEITTGKVTSDANALEGEVRKLGGYTVDIEGNVLMEEARQRVKFDLQIRFNTNMVWEDFELNTTLRPTMWKVKGFSDKQQLVISMRSGDQSFQHTFSFSDLLNSAGALEMLGVPYLSFLAPATQGTNGATRRLSFGLEWTARQDWFKLGQSRVRTYDVEARILGEYNVHVVVSKVGEILRVELPGKLKLINEAFITPP